MGSIEQMGRARDEGLNTSVTPFEEKTGLGGPSEGRPVQDGETSGGSMSMRTNVRRSGVMSNGVLGGDCC